LNIVAAENTSNKQQK